MKRISIVLMLAAVLAGSVYGVDYISASVKLGGESPRQYDLVKDALRFFSVFGILEYDPEMVDRIEGDDGQAVLTTVAGDRLMGELMTQTLPYYFFSERQEIYLGDVGNFVVDFAGIERELSPASSMLALSDGSSLYGRLAPGALGVRLNGGAMNVPISSLARLVFTYERAQTEGELSELAVSFFYYGCEALRGPVENRYESLQLVDSFKHEFELPLERIVEVNHLLYPEWPADEERLSVNRTCHVQLRDGRTEQVELPLAFLSIASSGRNVFMVPSVYIRTIEFGERGSVRLLTCFGDELSGRLKEDTISFRLPGRELNGESLIKIRTDTIASITLDRAPEQVGYAPVRVLGEDVNVSGVSSLAFSVLFKGKALDDAMWDVPCTLTLERRTWWLSGRLGGNSFRVEVSPKESSFELFCYADGVRHAFRLKDLQRIELNGGAQVGDASLSDEVVAMGSVDKQAVSQSETGDKQSPKEHLQPDLLPGHVLHLQVLVAGEAEIDEPERRISSNGELVLPLLGRVSVEGVTLDELTEQLVELYSRYFREPQVVVQYVLEEDAGSPWGYVTVLGTVEAPGKVNIPPTQDLTVSMAIQLAGGFASSANDKSIRITRMVNDTTEQYDVNLRSVGARGELNNDMKMLPGDIVYVPEMLF